MPQPEAKPGARWEPPHLRVEFGSYFRPDPEEQQKVVAMVQAALGGAAGTPLVTMRAAVKRVASIFEIDNIDAMLDELEKEREAKQEKALEQTDAELEIQAKHMPEKPPPRKDVSK